MEIPLISIITVCYNAETSIRATIASVLSQDYTNYEYIIIDGKSTDGTCEIIKKELQMYSSRDVRFISEDDKGIFDAMNKGVRLSKGVYVNFMNAGDTFISSNVLKRIAPELDGTDFVAGVARTSAKTFWIPVSSHVNAKKMLSGHNINHQATFTKRKLLYTEGYDLNYSLISDDLYFIKKVLKEHCSYKPVLTIVCDYDSSGLSSNPKNYDKIIEERKSFAKTFFEGYDLTFYMVPKDDFISRIIQRLLNVLFYIKCSFNNL